MSINYKAISPLENFASVPIGNNIILDITNFGGFVSANATIIEVDGYLAWSSDAAQTGYTSSTKSTITDGYRYIINPSSNFTLDSTIDISLRAENPSGVDYIDGYYSFYTGFAPENFIIKNFDHFDNNIVDLELDPTSTSRITESGTELDISLPAILHSHENWYPGDSSLAPIGFLNIVNDKELLCFETRLTSFISSNYGQSHGGLVIYKDRQNAYLFEYFEQYAGKYVKVLKIVNNVASFTTSIATVNVNTTPNVYRIYWNKSNDSKEIDGNDILPNEMYFFYSSDDGLTFNVLANFYPDFESTKIGLYTATRVDNVSASAKFDYLSQSLFLENGNIEEKINIADSIEFKNTGGETQYQLGITTGKKIDEKVNAADSVEFKNTGGETQYQLGITTGKKIEEKVNAADSVVIGVDDVDYRKDKDDSDGNEFINSFDIKYGIFVDTTEGSFGNPENLDHYGAARDGYYYYDGYKTDIPSNLTGFGALSDGLNKRSWSFADQEPLAPSKDDPSVTGTFSLIADDTIHLSGSGYNNWNYNSLVISSVLKWYILENDFEISLDFSNFTTSGDYGLYFEVTRENHNEIQSTSSALIVYYYSVYWSSHRVIGRIYNESGTQTSTTVNVALSPGTIKIKREGSNVKFYYNLGAGDVLVNTLSTSNNISSDPVFVRIYTSGASSASGSVDISNFQIITGNTSTRPGWVRESFGTDRGNRKDMPTNMYIVATEDSVELIDVDNNLLWMRFLLGVSNLINLYSYSGIYSKPEHISWKNGMLGVNQTSDSIYNGSTSIVDFSTSVSREIREAGSSITGGFYSSKKTAVGQIAQRNDGKNFITDDNDWAVVNYNCFWIDFFEDSYMYWVVSNRGGLSIFRQRRWYIMDSPSVESTRSVLTSSMRFSIFGQDGYLFYNLDDSETLYIAEKSTWEAAIGVGTFSHDISVTMLGTRNHKYQYNIIQDESKNIYIASEEGVYRLAWPFTGTFELFFSSSNSSATHKILLNYMYISSIHTFYKNGREYLIVSEVNYPDAGSGFIMEVILLGYNIIFGRYSSNFSMKFLNGMGNM